MHPARGFSHSTRQGLMLLSLGLWVLSVLGPGSGPNAPKTSGFWLFILGALGSFLQQGILELPSHALKSRHECSRPQLLQRQTIYTAQPP